MRVYWSNGDLVFHPENTEDRSNLETLLDGIYEAVFDALGDIAKATRNEDHNDPD